MPDIRFATKFRSADTDAPGLVMEDDGTVWLVNPDTTRTQLPGGGGGGPGIPNYVVFLFEETAGAGTYTATSAIPAGSTIVVEGYSTTAPWDAATAELDFGVTGDLEAFENGSDVATVISVSNVPDPMGIYDATGAANLVASVTTTGAGGTTGRTSVFVSYSTPVEVTATKS